MSGPLAAARGARQRRDYKQQGGKQTPAASAESDVEHHPLQAAGAIHLSLDCYFGVVEGSDLEA